jgi:hypothetical protein
MQIYDFHSHGLTDSKPGQGPDCKVWKLHAGDFENLIVNI